MEGFYFGKIRMNIKKIFQHNFIKASSIVLASSFTVNILNYVFSLTMGRMLEPSEFGEVASLIGLAAIIGVPSVAITIIMAQYTAGFKTKNEIGLIKSLFKLFTRYSLIAGLIILIIFWAAIPLMSSFLKIDEQPFLIFGLILPVSLVTAVNKGALQGLQKFIPFSLIGVVASIAKLALAIMFIMLGFSVAGVIAALLFSSLLSYLYSLIKIKPQLKIRSIRQVRQIESKMIRKELAPYASMTFLTLLLLALFSNADIILAKHYLSSELAGQYAALSIIGKIVLYGSGSFVAVMFPMVSASYANGDGKEKKLLKISFIITAAMSGFVLLLFAVMPGIAVKILFGAKYLMIASYLGWFGLAMFFNVLSQVLISYFMAIHIKKYLYPLALIVILQLVFVIFFHNTILQITMAMLASSFLMLLAMIIVYFYEQPKQVKSS